MASHDDPPALVLLEFDHLEPSNPWFTRRGQYVLWSITASPEDASVFEELARDGTTASLLAYFDTEQPKVDTTLLVLYILQGLSILSLLLVVPLIACGVTHKTPLTDSVAVFVVALVVVLCCAMGQFACFLALTGLRSSILRALSDYAPSTYNWAFELLHNYTRSAAHQLKAAVKDDPATAASRVVVDKARNSTLDSIDRLRTGISQWAKTPNGLVDTANMLQGPLPLVACAVLGISIAVVVPAVLVAMGAWSRRRDVPKRDRRVIKSGAFGLLFGASLLLIHSTVAVALLCKLLPWCALMDTYVCAPYLQGEYAVMDDAVYRAWPPRARPDPFCRLVPSSLVSLCGAKGSTSINSLPACRSSRPGRRKFLYGKEGKPVLSEVARDEAQALRGNATATMVGDCFYPGRVFSTSMTSVCPLFTDNLVGFWAALALSVLLGLPCVVGTLILAYQFLTADSKPKERMATTVKKRTKIKRRRKAEPIRKLPSKERPPSPPIVPPVPLPAPAPILQPVAPPPAMTPPKPVPTEVKITLLGLPVVRSFSSYDSRPGPSPLMIVQPPAAPYLPPPLPLLPPPPSLSLPALPVGTQVVARPWPQSAALRTLPVIAQPSVVRSIALPTRMEACHCPVEQPMVVATRKTVSFEGGRVRYGSHLLSASRESLSLDPGSSEGSTETSTASEPTRAAKTGLCPRCRCQPSGKLAAKRSARAAPTTQEATNRRRSPARSRKGVKRKRK